MVDVLFSDSSVDAHNEILLPFIVPGFYFGRLTTAILLGILYVLPMFACHYWEYRKVKLDIGAMTREFLQGCLIRKYLNFTDESRRTVKPAIMQVSILNDTKELALGYEQTLKFIEALG